jgi:hypothetical protein
MASGSSRNLANNNVLFYRRRRSGGGSDAFELLRNEPNGLALDFTDDYWHGSTGFYGSAVVKETRVLSDLTTASSDFLAYTSPSVKMVQGEDGLLGYGAHNLTKYSEDFSQAADWFPVNIASAVANAANSYDGQAIASVLTGNGDQPGFANTSFNHLIGPTYAFVCEYKNVSCDTWLKFTEPGGNAAWFDTANLVSGTLGTGFQSISVVDLGSSWLRITVIYVASVATNGFYLQHVSGNNANSSALDTGVFHITRGHFRRTPADSTYLATTTAARYALPVEYSSGVSQGILIEEARTNRARYSTTFDASLWSLFGSVSRGSATTAPNGETQAIPLSFTGYGEFFLAIEGSTSANATISCWVKRNAGTDQTFRLKGVTTATTNEFSGDFTATDEWQRFSYVVAVGENGNYSITSDSSNSAAEILVWGFQVETGAFPTSLVETFASSVTRAADNISLSTGAFPSTTTAATILGEFVPGNITSTTKVVLNIGDVAGNERGSLTFNDASFGGAIVDGGAVQANITGETPAVGTTFKNALAYALNDAAFYSQGASLGTDASVTMPTPTTLNLGIYSDGTLSLNGYLRKAMVLPRRMTNAELISLTTP